MVYHVITSYGFTATNPRPLFAFSTSSSSSLPSLFVHHNSFGRSSSCFPLLISFSNIPLRVLNCAIRRGYSWPVRMMNAVHAGRDAYSVDRWVFSVLRTGASASMEGGVRGDAVASDPSLGIVPDSQMG